MKLGRVVDVGKRIKWISIPADEDNELPEDDNYDSAVGEQWWPGVWYKSFSELIRDIDQRETKFRAMLLMEKINSEKLGQPQGPIALLLGMDPPAIKIMSTAKKVGTTTDTAPNDHSDDGVLNFFDYFDEIGNGDGGDGRKKSTKKFKGAIQKALSLLDDYIETPSDKEEQKDDPEDQDMEEEEEKGKYNDSKNKNINNKQKKTKRKSITKTKAKATSSSPKKFTPSNSRDSDYDDESEDDDDEEFFAPEVVTPTSSAKKKRGRPQSRKKQRQSGSSTPSSKAKKKSKNNRGIESMPSSPAAARKLLVSPSPTKSSVRLHTSASEKKKQRISTRTRNSSDKYTFTVLWKRLEEEGWTVIKAAKFNKLHDWYYLKPHVDKDRVTKNYRRNVDYFETREDLINHMVVNDNK